MAEITIIVFVFLCVLVLFSTRDLFHPAVLVSGVWSMLLILYQCLPHPLWDLSDRFYKAVSLWVIPFVCCSSIIGTRTVKISRSLKTYTINETFYKSLYKYVILFSIGFIFAVIFYAGGLNTQAIRLSLLGTDFPVYLEILFYLNTFSFVYVLHGVMTPELLGKKKLILLLLLFFITCILRSNKTSFIFSFCGIIYMLKKKGKLSVKVLFILVICLMLLLVIVSLNRKDYDFEADSALENFLYIYLFSSLTAFDGVLNGEIFLNSGTWGESVLEFFYKVFNAFGADFKISDLGVWTNVPLPTNVYTAMRGPYLDGGFVGIAMVSLILGIIWGNLYAWQKKNHLIFVVFYAAMIGSLLFQFMGDYLFHTLSTTLQYFIFSLIISRGIKIGTISSSESDVV